MKRSALVFQLAFLVLGISFITFSSFAQTDTLKQALNSDFQTIPDEDAEFIGGYSALQKYITDSIVFPPDAIEKEIQGKVFVQFVVEVDGSISNIKVLRGIHPILDNEAIRLIQGMPKWKPAKTDKIPVRSQVRMPINFTITIEKIKKKKD